ncbi:MAG: ATP-grasp fold amidoligase family protein [Acidobacteriota bacterium]
MSIARRWGLRQGQYTGDHSDSGVPFLRFVRSSIGPLVQHLFEPIDMAMFVMRDYRRVFGHYPHILFPRTFNEKVQVRKVFDRRRQLAVWADKYLVRDYVERIIGPAVLPTLYHVTYEPSDIPFEQLPKQYVVKATHGSGWTYIVRDAATINKQEIIDCCKRWLSTNYYVLGREWIYRDIVPRIIIEEFLDCGTGAVPIDYKFHVFAGKAKFIQVHVGRYVAHRINFYDTEWNRIDCRFCNNENYSGEIRRPESLDTMIDYAQRLAGSIDFVRVDLYEVRGKVYFGELTSTPSNGHDPFYPPSWDTTFGNCWKMRLR